MLPLSGSQVDEIGKSSSFPPHFHSAGRQVRYQEKRRRRSRRSWWAWAMQRKRGSDNSSKPVGLYLIHCSHRSLETTTNKASSYSGWQPFVWLRCPVRLGSGGSEESGRKSVSSVLKAKESLMRLHLFKRLIPSRIFNGSCNYGHCFVRW